MGTDCALVYPHGLFRLRRCQTGRTSQTGQTSNRRPDSAGHTTAGIPHVLYSRSCLITPGGARAVISHRYCSAPRFFCRFGIDCALFYPHGLFVRRQPQPISTKLYPTYNRNCIFSHRQFPPKQNTCRQRGYPHCPELRQAPAPDRWHHRAAL